jgi:hypothetical protein
VWYREANHSPLDQMVKPLIRQSPFFKKLFDHFDINPRELWRVRVSFGPLDKSFAVTKGDDIVLNDKLQHKPITDLMPMIVHEMTHWLTAKREESVYFSDPEEVQGFEWAIAYEIQNGADADQIAEKFLPLIQQNVPEGDAHQMLVKLMRGARRFA